MVALESNHVTAVMDTRQMYLEGERAHWQKRLCCAVYKRVTLIFLRRPTCLWVVASFFKRIVSSGTATHGVNWNMDHLNIFVGYKMIKGGLKNRLILIQSMLIESIALALRGRC